MELFVQLQPSDIPKIIDRQCEGLEGQGFHPCYVILGPDVYPHFLTWAESLCGFVDGESPAFSQMPTYRGLWVILSMTDGAIECVPKPEEAWLYSDKIRAINTDARNKHLAFWIEGEVVREEVAA